MSTRCCIEFCEGDNVWATVYRHSDGYPDGEYGVPADLLRFLMDLKKNIHDTRFGDACYLSAKFVVWQSARFSHGHPCDFLSLGISPSAEAHGDLAYVYRVTCGAIPEIAWSDPDKKKWNVCVYDLQSGTIEVEGATIKVEIKDSAMADKICAFVRKTLS